MTVLPSGKTQQQFIIQAIGILAGAANISVRSANAKAKAFNLMGIDPAEFDGTTIGNETKARNPCDLAFNRNAEKLKKQGFVQSGGRGKYALTDLGYTRFQTMGVKSDAPVATPSPTPTTPVATATIPKPKPAKQVSAHRVTVMAGGSQLATPAVLKNDSQLLDMQKTSSPCFGIGYTNNSKVCGRCPIAGMCQRKRMGGLAQLASLVKQGVKDGNLGVILGLVEPPAPVVTEAAPEPAPEPSKAARTRTMEALPVQVDGVPCDHCGTEIPKGSKGIIIEEFGFVHEHCVDQVLAQRGA